VPAYSPRVGLVALKKVLRVLPLGVYSISYQLCKMWTAGICFPSLRQVPINVTSGGPRPLFISWIDWSNVSKVPCSRKQQKHQSLVNISTWNFSMMASPLGHVVPHTHTRTHARTHARTHTHTQTRTHTQTLHTCNAANCYHMEYLAWSCDKVLGKWWQKIVNILLQTV